MGETVGLIGIGNIGSGMCRRMLEKGITVIGFDTSTDATQAAARLGASIEASVQALASRVSVIVSSLPNPSVVKDVARSVIAHAKRGTTFIETSTIDPHTIRDIAREATAAGIEVLDVALSGEPPQAAKGELVFQVGGPDSLVDRHLRLLEVLAKKINRTGEVGTAKTVKLVNNLMSIGNVAVAAEAFVLGVKCGMDPVRLYEILSISGGRSAHFITSFSRVLEGDYAPGFKTSLALKDLGLIVDLAADEKYATRIAPVISSIYRELVDQGYGDDHFASPVKLYEKMAGISVRGSGRPDQG